MNHGGEKAVEVQSWLRAVGSISRATPYFKGKWRIMDWAFRHWFIHVRRWDDVRVNPQVMIACKMWDEVQFGIWWGGEAYEVKQTPFWKSLLHPGMVVFDIGANVGYYSLLSAPMIGSSGRVFAFEPAPPQFALLKANVERNGFRNVQAFELALSDREGQAVLHLDDGFNTGSASLRSVSDARGDDPVVSCTTLDAFVIAHSIDRLDLAKIDVEGFELGVLRGAQETIERFHPTLMIEVKDHHLRLCGCTREELYAWVIARGYQPFRILSGCRLGQIDTPEDGVLVAFLHRSRLGA